MSTRTTRFADDGMNVERLAGRRSRRLFACEIRAELRRSRPEIICPVGNQRAEPGRSSPRSRRLGLTGLIEPRRDGDRRAMGVTKAHVKTVPCVRDPALAAQRGDRRAQLTIELLAVGGWNAGIERLRADLPCPVPIERVVVSGDLLR
jgi:hypothetical protein